MDILTSQVGIDVSLDELVVSVDQNRPLLAPNTESGCDEVIRYIPVGSVVHLEATGGYERLIRRKLTEAGLKVVLHNPLKARRLAQSQGIKAKTDSVDAKVLSKSGQLLPERKVKSISRQELADHSRAIQTLKETIAGFRKRAGMPELDQSARDLYVACILDLKKKMEASIALFEQRVKQSECAKEYKLLQSIPGVGVVTARICVCEFPEDLHERSADQIASYAGLAPIDNSSGRRRGKSRLGHGNSRLKGAFYMPALSTIRDQAWANTLYAGLLAKGKCHQSAMVAVMRRLLVRAVAVVKRGSAWQAEPLKD